jgi:hypothetical protein
MRTCDLNFTETPGGIEWTVNGGKFKRRHNKKKAVLGAAIRVFLRVESLLFIFHRGQPPNPRSSQARRSSGRMSRVTLAV